MVPFLSLDRSLMVRSIAKKGCDTNALPSLPFAIGRGITDRTISPLTPNDG